MITIVTNTNDEYIRMMEIAENYVCKRTCFAECTKYDKCADCYKDRHIECGIVIVLTVDKDNNNTV